MKTKDILQELERLEQLILIATYPKRNKAIFKKMAKIRVEMLTRRAAEIREEK